MTTAPRPIALVGHCGPDTMLLRQAIRRAVPDAEVIEVLDDDALAAAIEAGSALVVNRVLDGRFGHGDGGIELIRRTLAERPETPVALVSNFPEAQEEAEAAGARPGFGKSRLLQPDTQGRIADLAGG